jgi:hypothetical protein
MTPAAEGISTELTVHDRVEHARWGPIVRCNQRFFYAPVKGWVRGALGSFRNSTLFGGSGFDRFKIRKPGLVYQQGRPVSVATTCNLLGVSGKT